MKIMRSMVLSGIFFRDVCAGEGRGATDRIEYGLRTYHMKKNAIGDIKTTICPRMVIRLSI